MKVNVRAAPKRSYSEGCNSITIAALCREDQQQLAALARMLINYGADTRRTFWIMLEAYEAQERARVSAAAPRTESERA